MLQCDVGLTSCLRSQKIHNIWLKATQPEMKWK